MSSALGAQLLLFEDLGPQLIFVKGRLACKPVYQCQPCFGGFGDKDEFRPTLPSAQACISSKGRPARGIEVVHSHTGTPSKITTIQKDVITRCRSHTFSGVSGGGRFDCLEAVPDVSSPLTTPELSSCSIGSGPSYMTHNSRDREPKCKSQGD